MNKYWKYKYRFYIGVTDKKRFDELKSLYDIKEISKKQYKILLFIKRIIIYFLFVPMFIIAIIHEMSKFVCNISYNILNKYFNFIDY